MDRRRNPADLWLLPLEGNCKPVPFLPSEYAEFDGRFSPDMRWVAYVSNESGNSEIYVQGLSKISAEGSVERTGKWQVSRGGGLGPRWSGDSKELFYFDQNGKFWAIGIAEGSVFKAKTAKCLFQIPVLLVPEQYIEDCLTWDVDPNGNRFLLKELASEGSQAPFTVILNWTSLLKK
jgi:Tol biopolymer transport system component